MGKRAKGSLGVFELGERGERTMIFNAFYISRSCGNGHDTSLGLSDFMYLARC